MKRRCQIACALGLLIASAPAFADSDGAFCIGPDYLAFQLTELTDRVYPYQVRFYVMRFDDPVTWKMPVVLELPYFSSPSLKCQATTIYLDTWERLYSVSWEAEHPAVLSFQAVLRTTSLPGFRENSDTLGSVSEGPVGGAGTRVYSLPDTDRRYSYELHLDKQRDPNNSCIFKVRSVVVQKLDGDVVDTHEIFSGAQSAACGE